MKISVLLLVVRMSVAWPLVGFPHLLDDPRPRNIWAAQWLIKQDRKLGGRSVGETLGSIRRNGEERP